MCELNVYSAYDDDDDDDDDSCTVESGQAPNIVHSYLQGLPVSVFNKSKTFTHCYLSYTKNIISTRHKCLYNVYVYLL